MRKGWEILQHGYQSKAEPFTRSGKGKEQTKGGGGGDDPETLRGEGARKALGWEGGSLRYTV